MMNIKKYLICISVLMIVLSLAVQNESEAANRLKYEVKVFADQSKVLNSERHIKNSVLKDLGSEDKDEDFNVQFVDNTDEGVFAKDVTFRIRKSEYEDITEIQYKKRYPILGPDVDSAIAKAKAEGYTDAEMEVEYGLTQQTLSVSKEAETTTTLKGIALPSVTESAAIVKKNAAVPFNQFTSMLTSPKLIGPVHFERHEGEIDGLAIKIENWDLKNGNIVEISAKTDSLEAAKRAQAIIIKELKALNIYEDEDQLKTKLMFDQY